VEKGLKNPLTLYFTPHRGKLQHGLSLGKPCFSKEKEMAGTENICM
jgi:hypothetical protein